MATFTQTPSRYTGFSEMGQLIRALEIARAEALDDAADGDLSAKQYVAEIDRFFDSI